ncbi:membrane protein insertion efficiency factor YidD [Patescibacteria group bacterium]|nr:membrane protein insertion efficiency factor YidD [Patescibacteria group bacterium]MBU4452759.1 membrane protein insertion efficiency factor YidD [Patescibacteria group bacterium]MCG2687829.1 membrane protein insertion efficiency factor YidD [Candidatus Parcubacteria bacterium]
MSKIIRKIAVLPIILYQKTMSPDHGPIRIYFKHGYCRFYPTCSEYSKQAILKYGIIRGGLKGIYRVLRCNPWNKGGIDMP